MITVTVTRSTFRHEARRLIAAGIEPSHVIWSKPRSDELFETPDLADGPAILLPRLAAELIETALLHRDPEKYALLFAFIWRIHHGERHLADVAADPLIHRLERMRSAIRRDIHKMHAFLRFRRSADERMVAWFEPEHFILDAVAPFFTERFAAMQWSILTPIGSLHWDGQQLRSGPPANRTDAPAQDQFETTWRGYYESVFNPARLNPAVMRGHMPRKYWHNMPESQAIPTLIRTAPERTRAMLETQARSALHGEGGGHTTQHPVQERSIAGECSSGQEIAWPPVLRESGPDEHP